jgi:hypothetical protein
MPFERTKPLVAKLLVSSLLSKFIENKYFHGNVGTYKIEGAPKA